MAETPRRLHQQGRGNPRQAVFQEKPDAAAPQLAAMDEEAAAALLLKLSAKTSSAILNEMDTGKAARLVSVMIGAARPGDKGAAPEKDAPRNASAEQPKRGTARGGEASG